jgi:hypothetical protein
MIRSTVITVSRKRQAARSLRTQLDSLTKSHEVKPHEDYEH